MGGLCKSGADVPGRADQRHYHATKAKCAQRLIHEEFLAEGAFGEFSHAEWSYHPRLCPKWQTDATASGVGKARLAALKFHAPKTP